jgi:hypothetical protein
MPIWVTVSGVLALLLGAAIVSSTLLGGSQMGGVEMEGMDHNGGQSGPVTPSEPPGNPTPQIQGEPSDGPGEHAQSDGPGEHTPSDGPGEHTRSDDRRGH